MIATYEEGGFKMLDVECFIEAQKVMWVKRLVKDSWKIYPRMLLNKLLEEHSFQCKTDVNAQTRYRLNLKG